MSTPTLNQYKFGSLKLTKQGNRFTLEGDITIGGTNTDHSQLLYEALEIAAASKDKFAPEFADFCAEYLELTKDWDKE